MKYLFMFVAVASLSACVVTPNYSGNVYGSSPGRYYVSNEQTVRMGYVESVREVVIDRGQSGVGAATGAALGGLAAGSTIGKGNGSVAAAIVGAVAGGIVGQNMERNATMARGLEITVRLDNGEIKAVTQLLEEPFNPGDRVRLLSDGMTTRVTH